MTAGTECELDSAKSLSSLLDRYRDVRSHSEQICDALSAEDCVIQSMPDVSPIRWHLAHTTWFFETFILKRTAGYEAADDRFEYLFNSYYNTVGDQYPRSRRGLLSRPSVRDILAYRSQVDSNVVCLLDECRDESSPLRDLIELGLQHEQQHQELMLTDIKHVLSCNPLGPAMIENDLRPSPATTQRWIDFPEGLHEIGFGEQGFAFDNECPRHRVFVEPFQLSQRLVSNGEYLDFVEDGGYRRPEFWLSMGWDRVCQESWDSPLYWSHVDGERTEFTLGGNKPLDLSRPVTHVSYFEADAFARWAGHRLATEAEWEIAASQQSIPEQSAESFFDEGFPVHPGHVGGNGPLDSMFGSVWQWTSSSYSPYPGYRAPDGALGEYNGKFMCNQYVLRGSSCATSAGHARPTYRNFFPPEARWQFTGIRLARSVEPNTSNE